MEKFKSVDELVKQLRPTEPVYCIRRNSVRISSKYFKNKGHYILSNNFFNQPHEIVFRSIVYLFKKVGNKYYSPRGKSVDMLISKFGSGEIKKINI